MTMATKKSIFKAHLAEWLAIKGDRKKRSEMIKEISHIAKIHPKSVGRSFRRIQMKRNDGRACRGRSIYYTKDVDAALYDVWETANRPCGELLLPVIREYVAILARDSMWKHGDEATEKLLEISEATARRRTSGFRRKYDIRKGKSVTRASELKHIIPIFKGPWHDLPPGSGQLDTVAHCGGSIAGDYAYTVNYTDTALYWGVRAAQWNKGQEATLRSLERIKERLPFRWRMAHPDTGSEFINWMAKAWCEAKNITLTRSEPGRKNDNMYVEERNGHVVRKYLGWQRLDHRDVIPVMNEYFGVLDQYLNHFQAVRRTLEKTRVGSRYVRTFEKKAETPYQRLMKHKDIAKELKERVRREHESLNPLLLKKKLDILREKIYKMQKRKAAATE